MAQVSLLTIILALKIKHSWIKLQLKMFMLTNQI